MFAKYTLGLDLGQQSDYTVLTVAEPVFKADGTLLIQVPHIYRFPLRISYVHVVEYLEKFIESRELEDYVLVVDHTGVGRPVVDLLNDYKINTIGLTITGGRKVNWHTGRSVTVPKLELISRLQVAMQCKSLQFAEGLECMNLLIKELINFSLRVGKTIKMEAAGGNHDDMVMSLAMVVWYIEDKLNRGKRTRIIGSQYGR